MSTLRYLRERKGLTVSQLAAKSSISSRVILDYEDGKQPISLSHAKLLAKALWVGIEDLMPPAGAAPPPPLPPSSTVTTPSPSPRPTPAPAAPTQARSQSATASPVAAPPAYRPVQEAPPREGPRTVRPVSGDGSGGRGSGGQGAGRTTRPARPAPPPPGPITEGQLEELRRLATKLEITQEQLEERVGKALSELNRPEAKDWIKRARGMAEELAPSRKVPYGQWPEAREDQEAAYLKSQQEASSFFIFKLFNGEQFSGTISDFTPYTITIKEHDSGNEIVLRKLAVAYYCRTEAPAEKAPAKAPKARSRARAAQQEGQAIDSGVASDRVGEPAKPEIDNMDEDRGV